MPNLNETSKRILTGQKPAAATEPLKEEKEGEVSEAFPGYGKNREASAPSQGGSKKSEFQTLEKGSGGGKTITHSDAPLAAGKGAMEKEPVKQGSSSKPEIQDLGKDEPGKKVSEKAKETSKKPVAKGKPGEARPFKTTQDPTSVIDQDSSKGNVAREEAGDEDEVDVIELTDDEYDALSDEEKAQLELIDEADETVEEGKKPPFEKKDDDKDDKKKDDDKDDKKKKDDDKDDKDDKKAKKEDVDVNAEVDKLFEGQELSDEFKKTARDLFNAAVAAKVDDMKATIKAELEEEAAKMVEESRASMVESVDKFLNEAVAQWLKDNEVPVVSNLRADIAEEFMERLRDVFVESYIEVPDEKVDLLADMQEQLTDVNQTLESERESARIISEELSEIKKGKIVDQITEGMVKTDIEKFKRVIVGVVYESDESYSEKLRVIKENVFPKAPKTKEPEPEVIEESSASPRMKRYVETLSRSIKKS